MRLTLTLEGIDARGTVSVQQPLVWPVWYAVDAGALQFLFGDTRATGYVHAPGPLPAASTLAWDRELVHGGVPDDAMGIGLAVLYTDGGATSADAQTRYETFTAQVRRLSVSQAVRAAGLSPLAAAFGVDADDSAASIERFVTGVDRSVLRAPDAAQDGVAAFHHVAELLARFTPAMSMPTPSAPVRDVPVREIPVTTEPVRDVVRPTPPPISTRPLPLPPRLPVPPRPAAPPTVLTPGTGNELASLVQFWPVSRIKADSETPVRRTLPTRTLERASITLKGVLRRDG